MNPNGSLMEPKHQIWGELFIDEQGAANFRFHVEEGVGFLKAQEALKRFSELVYGRLTNARKCPFYEEVNDK